jgi:cation diffusion facilitator CzcD-associated flavoprotein CzcO
VANGHNWDPRVPEIPGTFSGEVLHAAIYKTPDILQGKRVLVVGAGNSGCDIAVESAQHAARTWLSMRRGYHYLPKFWRGQPIDVLNERLRRFRVPLAVRRGLATVIERVMFGAPGTTLPRPDHKLFESHPIINSQLFYYAAHGRVGVKPDVAELCGDEVRFADGSREPIDVIIYATGYNISFPFLDRDALNWRDGKPRLFMNVFHPADDDLFVVGLIQPDSGQFGLVDYQSRLVAKFIAASDAKQPQAESFRKRKAETDVDLSAGVQYVDSPRHLLEVEHYSYRERLKKLLAEFA